jgi:threonine dehydrogenase-like Zn-dependent dehydrogenase
MNGIWFTKKGRAEFVDEPDPECREDAVLLKTLYSGLSNDTERNKLMGGNYHSGKWPDRIGYQHVSEVIECGRLIRDFKVGDILFTGTYPGHVSYHLARESDLVARLPDSMDLPSAALFGVAAVSMHNTRRVEVTSADRVLVLGLGLIGLFSVQASLAMGAEVTVADRNEDRLEIARSLGARIAVNTTDDKSWEGLRSEQRFNACLECSGGQVLDHIVGTTWGNGLLAKNARLSMVASRSRADLNFNAASSCRLVLLFSTHFAQTDLEEVIDLTMQGTMKPGPLVRAVVPINEAIGVYDTLRDEKQKLLGTVFDWKDGVA